jgi:hypothetical protein
MADASVEQAHVVPDLGDGADRGARVVRCALLVNRDCRREAVNVVHIGLVHLAEELPGIRRERLDVAALSFGEDGIEGEATLAGAGEAGDDHQLIAWNRDVYIFEIMLARPSDDDGILRHWMNFSAMM